MPPSPGKLNEAVLSSLQTKEKQYRLSDGKGLYLVVTPRGKTWWRFKYRFAGRENQISLGVYPHVSLPEARKRLGIARGLLAKDLDPSLERKKEKLLTKEQAARDRATLRAAASPRIKVSLFTDGAVEIWKGRSVLRLSRDEARQVAQMLAGLNQ